ncbi:MAG: hypothetical protein HY063_12925 [Bacteroidetes bacterium]|nr:hypothetical protein [Bacteroidota bacterium]
MIAIYLTGAGIISGIIFFNRHRTINYFLVFIFLILQWAFTIYSYTHLHSEELSFFRIDALAIILLATLSIISIPAFYHSYIYFLKHKEIPRQRAIYFSAMVVLIMAMSAAYLSSHIAVTWVFIELTTLSASALVYHRRNIRSLEGTWKYIFVCSISITLVFIGILFLSIALQQSGSTDLSFSSLLAHASSLNEFWMRLAFIFVFTGLTVKAGLVPMYTAGIDAKDKAPSPAGALFSSALMNVGFIGIFRFYEVVAQTSLRVWASNLLIIAGALSVFVAAVYMLKVKNIKRMLAYSSVEHMGIIFLGIAAGGIGYYAAILHIIFHAFTKAGMFFQVGQVYRIYKSKNIFDTGNYFNYNLAGALVLLFGFLCAAAIPPSGMFISEFLIFRSLFEAHYIFVLVIILILLAVIIWAFGKNIFKLLFTPAVNFKDENVENIKWHESSSQFILLGLVIYLGFNPPPQMLDLINEAIKNFPR